MLVPVVTYVLFLLVVLCENIGRAHVACPKVPVIGKVLDRSSTPVEEIDL